MFISRNILIILIFLAFLLLLSIYMPFYDPKNSYIPFIWALLSATIIISYNEFVYEHREKALKKKIFSIFINELESNLKIIENNRKILENEAETMENEIYSDEPLSILKDQALNFLKFKFPKWDDDNFVLENINDIEYLIHRINSIIVDRQMYSNINLTNDDYMKNTMKNYQNSLNKCFEKLEVKINLTIVYLKNNYSL